MTSAARAWLESAGAARAAAAGLVLGALFEVLTCLLRFGADLQSTRDSAWLARFTFGYRIHHGYLGLLLLVAAAGLSRPLTRNLALVLGTGLLVSDLVHHFVVLWWITGSPQFDLTYPR